MQKRLDAKRLGFDKAFYFIPGLFDDDYNFKEIDKDTASMIEEQKLCLRLNIHGIPRTFTRRMYN